MAKKFWVGSLLMLQWWLAGDLYFCSLGASSCSLLTWTSLGFLPIWLPRSSLTVDYGWGSGVSAPPVMQHHFCHILLVTSESQEEGDETLPLDGAVATHETGNAVVTTLPSP